jgi:hypothetical protein
MFMRISVFFSILCFFSPVFSLAFIVFLCANQTWVVTAGAKLTWELEISVV